MHNVLTVYKLKKNHYGKIINIASMAAFMGLHNQAGYVASKSGVARLTRALAVELGEYGIMVNQMTMRESARFAVNTIWFCWKITVSPWGHSSRAGWPGLSG